MAGNHSLAGALLASTLLHASVLYAPLSPLGSGGGRLPPVLQAVLLPPAEPVPVLPPVAVAQSAAAAQSPARLPAAPPVRVPESVEDSDTGRGSEPVALLPVIVTTPVLYYRPHELTRRPILRRPALQEEAGRLYPVSETRLLVRINESGTVDEVILMAANHAGMAEEALSAFRRAEYFPGMIGSSPARAELLIQVLSSPTARVVNF
jgi:hypothetical protein